ncbi:protein IQ-DOMAIN 2-like [Prosopis cineraria]|uniref:protein IQ-DOMAIN 2-like n=1 Tax=Prosopis cineraria TaxID=364024 RepID=UPI00240F9604|nr:protein IQ-DOMAIN 2-like [Prosopis cineraria]XP_054794636.1 protein IQ-DOMAIN 2-like [Prosopis cineraria]
MGRKGNWFSNVKKAFSPESKKKEDQKASKSKKKWFGKQKLEATSDSHLGSEKTARPSPHPEEIKSHDVENESSQSHVHAVATTVNAERPIPAAQTAAVAVQAPKIPRFAGKSREEVATLKIQTAFRGYLARRALRALRGLVRLRTLMEGPIVKRQATSTLRSMQTLARVQSQIRSRRIRMFEENQALQRQLLHKHAKELESMRIGEEWDDSLQSKEQIEAKLLQKYEAAMRREKALAYAFTHQQTWKNSYRSINPMFMDPTNPSWGWSWLERWMAARTWESQSKMEKEMNDDHSSVRSSSRSITGGEISKSYARYQLNSEKHSPTASQIPDSPSFRLYSTPSKPASRKLKKASPKDSFAMDDDIKSVASAQSGRFRRHSIGGASVRDDESLASSPAVPSYMVATQSAKAKSRTQSPLAAENGTPQKAKDKGSFGTAKKRLSYPPSPARPWRHSSGPPKVENNLTAEITMADGGAA